MGSYNSSVTTTTHSLTGWMVGWLAFPCLGQCKHKIKKNEGKSKKKPGEIFY